MSTTSSIDWRKGEKGNFYEVPSDHPLCLCEYVNKEGERSHLLMCCCNCEAFDTLCTNLCCGSDELTSRSRGQLVADVIDDMSDRCRVPCPGGARRLDVDYLISFVSLVVYACLGTINFVFSVLVIFCIPSLVYFRFFTSRLSSKSTSTRIAFYMLLNSFCIGYFLFNFSLIYEFDNVVATYEKHLVNLFLIACVAGLVYMKYSNPGFITSNSRRLAGAIGNSEEKCSKCQIKRDSFQSGHCPICHCCIYRRDHHCFWVDNCIGYLNHKAFVAYLILLLTFLVYSFSLIMRRLGSLQCKLGIPRWRDKNSTETPSCLFDVFYANFARSFLTLMCMQLVPLIAYLNMLLLQQMCFVSIGLTQNQLFKLSQKNVRFSLALYIMSNFKLKRAMYNLFMFVTKLRRLTDFLYNDHLV